MRGGCGLRSRFLILNYATMTGHLLLFGCGWKPRYDEFAEFEIVLVALLFHRQHEIVALALENREYRSEEGQRFCVDQVIRDVDVDSIDLLVIPGGDPAGLVGNQELKEFIEKLVARNKKVAAICGGAEALAGMGFLKGKKCTGGTSGETIGNEGYSYFADAHV